MESDFSEKLRKEKEEKEKNSMNQDIRKAIIVKFADYKPTGLKFRLNKSCTGCSRALLHVYSNEMSFCSGISQDELDIIMFCAVNGKDIVDMRAMHIIEAYDMITLLSAALGSIFDHLSQKEFMDLNTKIINNIFGDTKKGKRSDKMLGWHGKRLG